jgi:hypothetical protein
MDRGAGQVAWAATGRATLVITFVLGIIVGLLLAIAVDELGDWMDDDT